MESIWQKTAEVSKESTDPLMTAKPDVIVIGGGLAGILTAFLLQEQGKNVIVLEADTVGSGQTGHTTAKVTSQHGLIYEKLIQTVGEKQAGQYFAANQGAIDCYRDTITSYQIECGWKMAPAYLYDTEDDRRIRREVEAAKRLGIQASFTTETELPFPVKGAICFRNQASFHPLKFLYGIAGKVSVYEQTPVIAVEENRVRIRQGAENFWLETKAVVFATHYPFLNRPGYYFTRMHQERSYALALKNAGSLEGLYLGVDTRGLSLRSHEDYIILAGGNHRTGDHKTGGQYEGLTRAAKQFWPECSVEARWSAQDCMTLDGIPYIGPYSNARPDWYVATGFQKWGMTGSMVAARMITDQIMKRDNPWQAVFSPKRKNIKAAAKTFFTNSGIAARNLCKEKFWYPKETAEQLPVGHGGVVEWNEKKLGVYKDEQGEVFCVLAKCPHMGCQLEWNPDEKSWDCPCHGSRFDYHGNLIDNPAQTDCCRPE